MKPHSVFPSFSFRPTFTNNTKSIFAFLILSFYSCNLPQLERSILETLQILNFKRTQPVQYSLSVQATGILGTGLTLENQGESLSIPSDGTYRFQRTYPSGSSYDVQITNQPESPTQTCTVSGGTGTFVGGDILGTIQVNCSGAQGSVSGTITGLSGTGLQITNTTPWGSETININSTSFAFSPQEFNTSYSVSVTAQPTNPWQTCVLSGVGSGSLTTGGATVDLSCTTDSYPLQVQVVGIGAVGTLSTPLVVQLGGQTLNFTGDATQSFSIGTLSGSSYTVGLLSSVIETGNCTIPIPSGTMAGPASLVVVNCSSGFLVQGSVTNPGGNPSSILGTGGVLSLVNTGGVAFSTQTVAISNGVTHFTFPSPIPAGAQFQVQITTQPSSPAQICTLTGTGASPSIATASTNIIDLVLDCGRPIPTSSLADGTYSDTQTVTLSAQPGDDIIYTLGDGTQPDPNCTGMGVGYISDLFLTEMSNNTVKAIACRPGWTGSPILTVSITLQTASPTPSLPDGTQLDSGQNVSFSSATPSAWTCHQSDPISPADPSCGSTLDTCSSGVFGNFVHPGTSSQIVKTRSCRVGFVEGNIATLTYPIKTYTVSGTISGLTTPFSAGSFVLRNNSLDDLTISANGSFSFPVPIASGANYNVTVFSQPTSPWQTCVVTDGAGTITNAPITNVSVSCSVNSYTITGNFTTDSPLTGDLVVSNGSTSLTIAASSVNGSGGFASPLPSGTIYEMSITQQPPGQVCSIANQEYGTITNANITDFAINCVNGHQIDSGIAAIPLAPLDIMLYQGKVSTVAGSSTPGSTNATGASASFTNPSDITFDGKNYYVADQGNHLIRRITPAGVVTTFAGNGSAGYSDGVGLSSSFNSPKGITTDGTSLYVTELNGKRIRKIRISDQMVSTLAGDTTSANPTDGDWDGVGTNARFGQVSGIIIDGNYLYFTDYSYHKVRRLSLTTKESFTLSSGVPLNGPSGLTKIGNTIYVANAIGHTIASVNATSGFTVTAFGSDGIAGYVDGTLPKIRFHAPTGITKDGSNLYVTDANNNRIRRIDLLNNRVSTLAGNGGTTFAAGKGSTTGFLELGNLTNDGKTLVFAHSHAIRRLVDNSSFANYPLSQNLWHDYSGESPSIYTATTPVGNVNSSTGRFAEANGAVEFTGGYIDTGNPIQLTPTDSFSIAFWIKPTTISSVAILGKASAEFRLLMNAQGGLSFHNFESTPDIKLNVDTVPFVLGTDRWTHVAFVMDRKKLRNTGIYGGEFFINGRNLTQLTQDRYPASSANSSSTPLMLGGNIYGTPNFNGKLADLRVYKRPLNLSEIHELAQKASFAEVKQTYSQGPIGLVSHFQFTGTSAEMSEDSGPIGISMSTSSSPVQTQAPDWEPSGAARFLTSTAQHYTRVGTALPLGATDRTVCTRVFPQGPGTIFSYGTNLAGQGINLSVASTNYLFEVVGGGSLLGIGTVRPNTWQLVCFTYSDTSGAKLFVDGSIVASSSAGAFGAVNTGNTKLNIGRNMIDSNYFLGKIDDIQIYNSELTEMQIRNLSALIPRGLVARYDLNGNFNEVSGLNTHLTPTNAVNFRNRHEISNAAQSFSFGSFTSSANTAVPVDVNQFTATAWVRPMSYAGGNMEIFHNGNGCCSGFALAISSTGKLRALMGNVTWLDTDAVVPLKVWSHIAVRRSGGDYQIFLNGRQIVIIGSYLNNPPNPPEGTVYSANLVNVQVDELHLYSRALSNEEIVSLAGYHPYQISTWHWNPVSSQMRLHLQADSFASGDSTDTWLDNSGFGNFSASGTPGLNTTPSGRGLNLSFSASPYYFSLSRNFNPESFTFYTVANNTQADTTNRFLLGYTDSPQVLQVSSFGGPMNFSYGICENGALCSTGPSGNLPSSSEFIFGITRENSVSNVTTTFLNGNSVAGNLPYSGAFGTNGDMYIGADPLGLVPFQGTISEAILFHGDLGSTPTVYPGSSLWGRKLLECYLSQKYQKYLPESTGDCP